VKQKQRVNDTSVLKTVWPHVRCFVASAKHLAEQTAQQFM